MAIRPTCLGPPLPGIHRGLSGSAARDRNKDEKSCKVNWFIAARADGNCGEELLLAGLPDGLRHEGGHVLRVLPLDQLRSHLAVAGGASLVDRVER